MTLVLAAMNPVGFTMSGKTKLKNNSSSDASSDRFSPLPSKKKGVSVPKLPPTRIGPQRKAPKSLSPLEFNSDFQIKDNWSDKKSVNMYLSRPLSQTGSLANSIRNQSSKLGESIKLANINNKTQFKPKIQDSPNNPICYRLAKGRSRYTSRSTIL